MLILVQVFGRETSVKCCFVSQIQMTDSVTVRLLVIFLGDEKKVFDGGML